MSKIFIFAFVFTLLFGLVAVGGATNIVALDDDSLSEVAEIQEGTDPLSADTDGDGLFDGKELQTGTDPTKADTDGDGLNDSSELNEYDTDPTDIDTDSDGLTDGKEVDEYGTDPLAKDTDNDGLSDEAEINIHHTNPAKNDSDGDGLSDKTEVDGKTDATDADTDSDGLDDGDEINEYKTDAIKADTDGDGLVDGDEVHIYDTNPIVKDTDGDGLGDGEEVNEYSTDPLVKDTDGDGLSDKTEVDGKTDATIADTDSDGLDDGDEINNYGSDPTAVDTDGDGLGDGAEVHNDVLTDADPTRMDIYVEVDYMAGYKPTSASMAMVSQAYENAPIENPDGSMGIDLHILMDDKIGFESSTTQDDRDRLMESNFNHENDGFHYAIAVKDPLYMGQVRTGFSAVGWGNGQFVFATVDYYDNQYSSDVMAGIFMHELGHSAGIGSQDYDGIDSREVPYEEYHSSMNYNAPWGAVTYNSGPPYDDWEYIQENIYTPEVVFYNN